MNSSDQDTLIGSLFYFIKKHAYFLFIFCSFLLASGIIWLNVNKEKKETVITKKNESPMFQFYSRLDFAGELFPAEDALSLIMLEKEIERNKEHESALQLLAKRSSKWFPLIEPILEKYSIPNDFKYIALIESRLINVVSPRGASGFWQFVAPTAVQYGLEVNEDIDERYHVEKSTEAACKYFKDAYNQFQNWTLVAASYNLGIGGIQQELKKQKTTSYYKLNLNQETKRYVFKIYAIKALMCYPDFFNLDIDVKLKSGIRTQYKIVKVDSTVNDLISLAQKHKISLSCIKYLNPWITGNKIDNPSGKKYFIQIPSEDYAKKIEEELIMDSINRAIEQQRILGIKDSTSDIHTTSPQQAI